MFKKIKKHIADRRAGKHTAHTSAFNDAVYAWKAPEYLQHEKSVLWFVLAGILAAGLIVYGLLTDGWTFSLAVLAFSSTYYLFHRTKPPIVDVAISSVGIKIGHHRFPYTHIRYFWVVYDPPFVSKLYLRMTSRVHPDIFVSLEDADAAEVRRVLRMHLEEHKGGSEPVSDALVRLFKL